MSERRFRLAVFASGAGSNAINLADFLANGSVGMVSFVVTDNPKSGVIEPATARGIPVLVMSSQDVGDPVRVIGILQASRVSAVVLAGYLRLIPSSLLRIFEGRVLNLHPALLPRHGGKGMYGTRVHRAVRDSGDTETGITLHEVNEEYDRGRVVSQYRTAISDTDTVESIEAAVRGLENALFPAAVADWLRSLS